MKILGINGCGWLDVSHDASAALVEKGRILWAIEEERFTRLKRAYDQKPLNALKFIIDYEGITLDSIDLVAFSWDWSKYIPRDSSNYESDEYLLSTFFPKKYFSYNKKPKILRVEHHLAHASSAFRCSGFKKSAILVLDGQGESCSSSIWIGEVDRPLLKIWSNKIEDSLGYFYSAVCRYIGMKNGDEGKLMGLAAYGISDNLIISKFFFILSDVFLQSLR